MPVFNYDAARRQGIPKETIEKFLKGKPGLTIVKSPLSDHTFLDGVANFLGEKEFGEGLGLAASKLSPDVRRAQESSDVLRGQIDRLVETALKKPIGDPGRDRLLREAQRLYGEQSTESQAQAQEGPSNRAFLGSAAATALNYIGARTAVTGKYVQDVARLGGLGAAGGVAEGVRKEEGGKKIAERASLGFLIGALFPTVRAVKQQFGKGVQKVGEKIESTIIRPTAADVADGFKVENVNKYKVGGSLQQTLSKTSEQLNGLSDDLNKLLKANADEAVDVQKAYDQTQRYFLGDKKLANFGNTQSVRRVLDNLGEEISGTLGDSRNVNLYDATLIKRGAGTKGAWVFGSADPDATATEKVYTKFYQYMRKAIEEKSPETLKEINRKISDLIPIQNAVLRRLPIAERNSILGLTDTIGLYASIFDPRALLLTGAKLASRSGRVANLFTKIGENLHTSIPGKTSQAIRAVGRSAIFRGIQQ